MTASAAAGQEPAGPSREQIAKCRSDRHPSGRSSPTAAPARRGGLQANSAMFRKGACQEGTLDGREDAEGYPAKGEFYHEGREEQEGRIRQAKKTG
ncbi:MAG: hypothetical protein GTO03_04595 [Planctomycetales bacterium]|nr:hypothetical protein [Planctomycetales bacterium]